MKIIERPSAKRERLGDERDFAERRLAALAQAVRQHESTGRGHINPARPHDRRLYTRLRELCGERLAG
jgi:hypothetical protein